MKSLSHFLLTCTEHLGTCYLHRERVAGKGAKGHSGALCISTAAWLLHHPETTTSHGGQSLRCDGHDRKKVSMSPRSGRIPVGSPCSSHPSAAPLEISLVFCFCSFQTQNSRSRNKTKQPKGRKKRQRMAERPPSTKPRIKNCILDNSAYSVTAYLTAGETVDQKTNAQEVGLLWWNVGSPSSKGCVCPVLPHARPTEMWVCKPGGASLVSVQPALLGGW